MTRILPLAIGAVLATAAFGQRTTAPNRYGSTTGFGSVLYPGTGTAPKLRLPQFPGGFGVGPRNAGGIAPRVNHPSHGRRVVVPYPVFVGGGYYGGFDGGYGPAPYSEPQYGPQAPQQPPVVIINQAYRPERASPVVHDYSYEPLPEPTLRRYEAPVHPTPDPKERAAQKAESERPTIYLIAFKDHTILPALAYWMEGDTLHYVTKEGTPNRASIELVDRDFSRQLNRERQVEFNLP